MGLDEFLPSYDGSNGIWTPMSKYCHGGVEKLKLTSRS